MFFETDIKILNSLSLGIFGLYFIITDPSILGKLSGVFFLANCFLLTSPTNFLNCCCFLFFVGVGIFILPEIVIFIFALWSAFITQKCWQSEQKKLPVSVNEMSTKNCKEIVNGSNCSLLF